MDQCMIWRDTHDKYMFYIGVKNKTGYVQYLSCFLDALLECFDLKKEEVENITNEPQPIRLVMLFPNATGE